MSDSDQTTVQSLVLLGRWDETPLIAWPGFCEAARTQFMVTTSFAPTPFSFLRQGLHEQYFLERSVIPMQRWFSEQDGSGRQRIVDSLLNDYYENAKDLNQFTIALSGMNLTTLTEMELMDQLEQWSRLPGLLAAPIFFTVLLDIWFSEGGLSAEIVDATATAREHCTQVYDQRAKPQAERLCKEFGHRIGFSWPEMQFLFPPEISLALSTHADLSDRIQQRKDFFVATYVDDHYALLSGESADAALARVAIPSIGTPRTSLTGRTAHPGRVRGQARRILSTADLSSLQPGEIMVSYQTSVAYEPLFDDVSAVLTELGGMTSHAAVVCAERRIPCLIGIDDLVVSVDTGDMLDVDCGAGTISVVKKA